MKIRLKKTQGWSKVVLFYSHMSLCVRSLIKIIQISDIETSNDFVPLNCVLQLTLMELFKHTFLIAGDDISNEQTFKIEVQETMKNALIIKN